MGRRYQFGGEYIQIAGRPKRTAERSKLLGDPLDVRLRKDLLQRRNCRAKPPHGHPHLVNAFRLGRERGGLVSQQLGEATAADLSQSRLDRHIGIQNDGLCVNRRGSGVAALHEPIAPLRFAAGLDTKRSRLQQLRGEVVESAGVTALELEFDLADRLSPLLAYGPDLAFVDRRLDRRSRQRLAWRDRASDFGHDKRPQIAGPTLRQARAAQRRIGGGATLRDRIFPPAPRPWIPPREDFLLDGLPEIAAP